MVVDLHLCNLRMIDNDVKSLYVAGPVVVVARELRGEFCLKGNLSIEQNKWFMLGDHITVTYIQQFRYVRIA